MTTINYIQQAQEFMAKNFGDNKYKRFSGDTIIEGMIQKEAAANSTKLTKLQKLQRITAFRSFDIDPRGFEGEQRTTVGLLAIKHAIQLINHIIKFDDIVKEGGNTVFTRTCGEFTAVLVARLDGFRVTIGKGEKTILDRIVGGAKIRHETGHYTMFKKVEAEVGMGIWNWNYSVRGTDIWEMNYGVKEEEIEKIKEAIRKAFVQVGLMTRTRGGEGFTVGNAGFGSRSRTTYPDVISIRQMYYGHTVQDYKLALETATKVLNSFGYTEAYKR